MADDANHLPLSPGWVLSGILGIITLLSSLVAMFYKKTESENTRTIAKLEERVTILQSKSDACESDRLELHKTCARHEAKIAILEEITKDLLPSIKVHKPRTHEA